MASSSAGDVPLSTAAQLKDTARMYIGETKYESTIDRVSGVLSSSVVGEHVQMTGTHIETHIGTQMISTERQEPRNVVQKAKSDPDYIDCLGRVGFSTSGKDLRTNLKTQWTGGTCDWFLQMPQYQHWHDNQDHSLLLLLGSIGMGKTMMCRFLKENLENSEGRQGRQRTVACFFCDYHTERSTATAVVAGLLSQLLAADAQNFEHIRTEYLQHKESLPDNFDNLWTIFYNLLKKLDDEVYLIIDGMDKCDKSSRHELFELLIGSLRGKLLRSTIKILLTSRSGLDFPPIADRPVLKIEQRDVSAHLKMSILTFIQVRVRDLPVIPKMKENIQKEIWKKAGETYLWASFVLQDLQQAHTSQDVDIKFENLPQDLHEVYDRMLRDIDPAKAKEAAFVLRMAAVARRPLTSEELGLLYVLRPKRKSPRKLQTLKQVEPYLDPKLPTACKALVKDDDAVGFVHESVKEHLLDDKLSTIHWSSIICPGVEKHRSYMFLATAVGKALRNLGLKRGISRYHVVPDKTHFLFLQICWTCFGTEELQRGEKLIQRKETDELIPNPDLQEFLESRPDLSYMIQEWHHHALSAGPALGSCRAWLARHLGELPNLRDVWLHRVVLAGDVDTARLLLDNQADVKTRWGDYGSILHGPSSMGNEEMVKLLLDHKADIDAKGRLFDNALEAASSNFHANIVRLLLERGAKVHGHGGNSCSALQIAAANGDTEIVRTLLQKKANVNSSGGTHSRPLLGAARLGHLEVVQLLLDKGADVNAQGQGHATALQAASCEGHLDVVKLLVGHKADFNATGGSHGSALKAAIDEGHKEVEEWLRGRGAEPSDDNDQGDNPLYLAALMGRVKEVKTLLENYDVNVQGGKHGSPLQAAAYQGHENVVRLLIDKKADVNAQGGIKGNALHAAAVNGHIGIMRMLLEHGVSANIRGKAYGTALNAALWADPRNRKEAVHLLLEKGALANVQSSYFGTPLQLAASKGDIDIAELLLDNGANVNAKGGKFGFALQAAAIAGKRDIIQLLLDRGANVNAKGGQYGSALQAAAFAGEDEIANLLLESGALVNAEGGQYGFALQAAAVAGKEIMVRLLLDQGANVNAEGGPYGTAVEAARCGKHMSVVQLLQRWSAKPDRKGSSGLLQRQSTQLDRDLSLGHPLDQTPERYLLDQTRERYLLDRIREPPRRWNESDGKSNCAVSSQPVTLHCGRGRR